MNELTLPLILDSHDYHQAAIDNLEAMLDPSLGVDAVLIGPHDLSCNLGTVETDYHQQQSRFYQFNRGP